MVERVPRSSPVVSSYRSLESMFRRLKGTVIAPYRFTLGTEDMEGMRAG